MNENSMRNKLIMFFCLGIFTFFLSGYILRGIHPPQSILLMFLVYLILFGIGVFVSKERSRDFVATAFVISFVALFLICAVFFAWSAETGVIAYDSSAMDANFEENNLTLTDVNRLASQHYSVEEISPRASVVTADVELLDSQFKTNYTVYRIKIPVPADKKMTDDERPEHFTLFVHQKDTDIGWRSRPRNNSTYPQEYVVDMIQLSFNVSDSGAGKYAEAFGEKVKEINNKNTELPDDIIRSYEPMFVPHQPDISAIVEFLNESGNPSTEARGNGYYLIEFYNYSLPYDESLPYGYKTAGSLFVHTECLKITHKAGNDEYAILIDNMGTLNVKINIGRGGFSLEEGKVVLKAMFENIGLNAELVDELEFGEIVV